MADAAADADSPVLFRTAGLAARAHRRGSGCCVVVFDPLGTDPSLNRTAFAEAFLAGQGLDAVHVLSASNNWYQDPDLPALMEAVRAFVARGGYGRVVAYGSSMGGYAALRFGPLAGAGAALAISPQHSGAPAAAPFEHRWAGLRAALSWPHEPPGRPLPPIGEAVVFFDPFTTDRHHAEAIRRDLPGAVLIPLPFSGHPSGTMLAEAGLLSETVRAAIAGRLEPRALRHAVRRSRRRSGHYLIQLAHRLPPRRLALKATLARAAAPLFPDEAFCLSYAALALECRGERDAALALHRASVERHPAFGPGVLRFARALWRADRRRDARRVHRHARALLPRDGSLGEVGALMALADGAAAEGLALLADTPFVLARPLLASGLRHLGRLSSPLLAPVSAALRPVALGVLRRTVQGPGGATRELAAADRE